MFRIGARLIGTRNNNGGNNNNAFGGATNVSVPLKGTKVEVQVTDFTSTTTITQQFKNEESTPIEAQYQFYLAAKQTVTAFKAVVDGKVINAVLKEKQEAKDTYTDAIASGGNAYLLEETSKSDVFSVSIGNLLAGKEVEVKITYVNELDFDANGDLVYTLAAEGRGTNIRQSLNLVERMNTPPLQFEAQLKMTSNIASVTSATHLLSFVFGAAPNLGTVTASLSGSSTSSADFIVGITLVTPHAPVGRIQRDSEGRYALMAALCPEFIRHDDEELYTEIIFLIDRSGSMMGDRIEQAKNTLSIFLRSLSQGTIFNIVGFGTNAEALFPSGSVQYNDDTLEKATAYAVDMEPNMGGTDILKPLKMILERPAINGYPRQVFILTDGEVGDTQKCIDFVRQHADTTRVFTFGVGNEASQALVKGLADAGEGEYEFCLPGQSMDAKVMNQLNRALLPSITNVRLSISVQGRVDKQTQQIAFKQAPYYFPPIFANKRAIAYALFDREPPQGDIVATFEGITSGANPTPFVCSFQISHTAIEEGSLLNQLAARRVIQDLEERRSAYHVKHGTQLKPGVTPDQILNEIKTLSLSYNVMCKQTAFVAIQEGVEAIDTAPTLRTFGVSIDNEVKRRKSLQKSRRGGQWIAGGGGRNGRGGGGRRGGSTRGVGGGSRGGRTRGAGGGSRGGSTRGAGGMQTKVKKSKVTSGHWFSNASDRNESDKMEVEVEEEGEGEEEEEEEEEEKNNEQKQAEEEVPSEMRRIIMKQKANGEWRMEDVVGMIGGLGVEQVMKELVVAKRGKEAKEEEKGMWVTAVVVAWLKHKYGKWETTWSSVVKKAERFISRQKKQCQGLENVFLLAQKFVENFRN